MEAWNWDSEEDVIIPQVDEIAVYENANGHITIRQRGFQGNEDDVISVPKEYLPKLIDALKKQLES